MLPHKIFAEPQFREKVAVLKERFVVGHEESLFLPDSQQKQVPIDGMSVFIDTSWSQIRDQKELNLPDQRKLVADYRCNEFKEEALKLVDSKIQQLQAESDASYMEDGKFNQGCLDILNQAKEFYRESAHHYDKEVF